MGSATVVLVFDWKLEFGSGRYCDEAVESRRLGSDRHVEGPKSFGDEPAERDLMEGAGDLRVSRGSSNRSNSNGSNTSKDCLGSTTTGATPNEPESRFERLCNDFEVSERDMRSEAMELRGETGVAGILVMEEDEVDAEGGEARRSFFDVARDRGR